MGPKASCCFERQGEMPRRVLESPARALAKRLRAWEVVKLRLLTLEYLQPREMSQPTELAASPLPPHSPSGSAVPRDPRAAVVRTDVSCRELGGLGVCTHPQLQPRVGGRRPRAERSSRERVGVLRCLCSETKPSLAAASYYVKVKSFILS